MPAISGSRLAPRVKKIQLKPRSTTPASTQTVGVGDLAIGDLPRAFGRQPHERSSRHAPAGGAVEVERNEDLAADALLG